MTERVANLELALEQSKLKGIPQPTRTTTAEPQDVAELSARLEVVEQEKNALVSQIADLSRGALDPSSELGVLVRQLESGDSGERIAAATGLFAINDPRTVQPLVDYYWKHRDEASKVAHSYEFMQRAFSDRHTGSDFAIRILELDDENDAEWAFKALSEQTNYEDFDQVFRPSVESIALRSKDALVRTRAKVVLQIRDEVVEEKKARAEDEAEWEREQAERAAAEAKAPNSNEEQP
jgi:hypothetical protein